jgi:hypothetical protein
MSDEPVNGVFHVDPFYAAEWHRSQYDEQAIGDSDRPYIHIWPRHAREDSIEAYGLDELRALHRLIGQLVEHYCHG